MGDRGAFRLCLNASLYLATVSCQVEAGETPEQAVVRELQEELGIQVGAPNSR